MKKLSLILFTVIFYLTTMAQEEARLLRFPAINGDNVVFSYAGDLYTVSAEGGTARRLTSHDGYEVFPRFSPDGNTIAFTAQYDGNTEVFTIPSEGGIPKRVTYTATLGRDDISDRMGPNNIVMAWTPDGGKIVYRSRKQSFNSFVGQLFTVSPDGGLSEEVPLASGGFCSFSPDGKKLAFNQVFREFRTWKYYKGGMADDIRIYDYDTKEITKITDNISQDIIPMWFGEKIYFISDRDRTMNLFVYDLKTKEIRKVTSYSDYDIKFPSLGNNAIIWERGGYLYKMSLPSETISKINVVINNDFLYAREELKDVSKDIYSYEIAPDGKRALFSARGDIWTVPAKEGIVRNLTKSSGAHDRSPVWSPDGKYIAYLSDNSGEYEIYIIKQDGSEEAVQLTKNAETYKYNLKWSPDGKKILWNDKKLRLRFVDIDSKKITDVAQSKIWEYNSFNWSPDSKWIAYANPEKNNMSVICLYSLEKSEAYEITKGWYSSYAPEFSENGKYLFYVSDRDFNPIYSSTEWNHAFSEMSRIYLITLQKKTKSPFAPENDEVSIKEEENTDEKKKTEKEEKDENIIIDIDGIKDRVVNLPVKTARYWGLKSVGDKLFYNYAADNKYGIKVFDLDKEKETDLGFMGGFEISADGKKMLVGKGNKYAIINLPSSKIKPADYLDLTEMKVLVDKKEEWQQIYNESWRQMRDFFYVENMHGLNWKEMHDKYEVLLPYVNNRNDLNYIIGELIGELNVGHAYVNGGDKPSPERIKLGLLGAKISRDKSGYYRIDKILKGENFRKNLRSPLTEVGVNAKEGEYIIAINGESVKGMNDIYMALIDKAGKEVELSLSESASSKETHNEIITPISDESGLYYYNWVQENIRKVNEATNGEVGYIHIPDMGPGGLKEFVKYFYPQLNKKALIIDDRGNGGGNVSPMIIERLKREVTRANMSRNSEIPGQTPRQMMLGPKVLLINQYSASDGDLFPYSFKKHGLGKVIGVRTWGGVVGIRGSLPFIDGADLRKPEFASYSSEESKWIIEGHGVEPDMVVENDPAREYMGIDDQLNKAIEVIKKELKNYKELPMIPEGPDKTK